MSKAVFEGLVRDENENACPVVYVGVEPTYVVVEHGFRYHVDARKVDAQVMDVFVEQMKGHGPEVTAAVLKFLGRDDLFTKAQVDSQMRNFDKHLDRIYENGIPENQRAMLGMMGFRVIINRHGDMVKLELPQRADTDG
jgi:hypothetical protein